MRCIVKGSLRTLSGEREEYQVPVEAPSLSHAITMAVETALMRGKRFVPESIDACYVILGFCRDCNEPVFHGGDGRSRRGELRCFDCGGAK